MKLGVSYIVFDGVELLEHSIKQIRNHVDFVQVIYQNTSWFGKNIKEEDLLELKRLERTNLIDELTLFTSFNPLLTKNPRDIVTAKDYERSKRQVGLTTCKNKGCTHYLCMDVDEFYVTEQFAKAKEYIISNNIDVSAVKFINYVNLPILHRGSDGSTVPFICKLDSSSKMSKGFFTKCDVTRGISNITKKSYLFSQNEILMHHMETVRKDLHLKYESTTRSIFKRERTNELIANIRSVGEDTKKFWFNKIIFPGTPIVDLNKVDNIFNIPYKKWLEQK